MAGFLVILGLFAIIVIHELGHFLAARAVGIRATKFYLFFPPALWRRQVGEVEYGIGWIPLGGFVKLPGMYRPRGADVHWRIEPIVTDLTREATSPEVVLRVASALRDLAAATDIDVLRRAAGELAEAVAALELPASHERRRARVLALLACVDDDCHERAYWRAALWRRMVVIFAGPLANVLLAVVVMLVTTMFFMPRYEQQWQVTGVLKDSPAEAAGVRKGDVIERWNGQPGKGDYRAFRDAVTDGHGEPLDLVVRRGDATGDEDAAPAARHSFHLDPERIDGDRIVGITVGYEPGSARRLPGYYRIGPGESARITWNMVSGVTVGVVTGLGRLAQGDGVDDVTTVVGFVQVAPEIERAGQLPGFIAMLSLIIALMNLLPLLPLDGGHLAFGVVEFLRRGRPLSREAFERFSFVGLALIVGLFLIGLGNDLGLRG